MTFILSKASSALRLLAFCFCTCLAVTSAAQTLNPPERYQLIKDAPASCLVRGDFDGDGKEDLFCAVTQKGQEDAQLLAMLQSGKTFILSKGLSMCCGSITAKGKVIDVHSQGMRGFTYYKFRWDAKAKDFQLIGYDTESFGNATGDGSGTSSINLLTGGYEATFNVWVEKEGRLLALPKVKRKIVVGRKIYMKGFDESADGWLADLNAKYLPKEVR